MNVLYVRKFTVCFTLHTSLVDVIVTLSPSLRRKQLLSLLGSGNFRIFVVCCCCAVIMVVWFSWHHVVLS